MKKIITFCLIAFLAVVSNCITAQSSQQNQTQTIAVDPNDLDPATLAKIKAKAAEQELKSRIDNYGKWVGIGKEVGVAVDEGLTAVTKHATAIADTKLGKMTMFIIVYKVIGRDIIQFIVGMILWIFLTTMFVISFTKNCLSKKTKDITYQDDGKSIKTIKESYIKADNDSMLAHAVFYAIAIGICCLIIFIH